MFQKFTYTNKLDVSPNSQYYAIISQNQEIEQKPVLVIVDEKKNIYEIVLKNKIQPEAKNHKNVMSDEISAVIVPEFKDITHELCKSVFDQPCLKVSIIKIPLVAEEHGSVKTFGGIVKEYS